MILWTYKLVVMQYMQKIAKTFQAWKLTHGFGFEGGVRRDEVTPKWKDLIIIIIWRTIW